MDYMFAKAGFSVNLRKVNGVLLWAFFYDVKIRCVDMFFCDAISKQLIVAHQTSCECILMFNKKSRNAANDTAFRWKKLAILSATRITF